MLETFSPMKTYFNNVLKGKKINDNQLLDIRNIDTIFTDGKNIDITITESDEIRGVEVDTTQLNSNSNLNDQIYIIDKANYALQLIAEGKLNLVTPDEISLDNEKLRLKSFKNNIIFSFLGVVILLLLVF